MAGSPSQVIDFLHDLGRRARPGAERELAELRAFARSELGLDDLQAWDIAFASEKLKEQRYAFSEQEVKQYFTEPKVLEGLFRIVETVFEVRIRPDTAPVWHPSVRFFRIERERPGRGRRRAQAGRPVLPRPVRAAGQAPGRLDGRRARALAAPRGQACRRRWRTWSATSRRRSSPTASRVRRC